MCMHMKHYCGLPWFNRLLCYRFRSVRGGGTRSIGKGEEHIDDMRGTSEQVMSYRNSYTSRTCNTNNVLIFVPCPA